MSIPLDRLYLYLETISKQIADNIIIYHFFPHGSKKIENLHTLTPYKSDFEKNWVREQISANLICHDQEPLNFDFYTRDQIFNYVKYVEQHGQFGNPVQYCNYIIEKITDMHLRAVTLSPMSCYDYTLLMHSEKNSNELKKYETKNFIGVYWWSHAIIAHDWFRYANYITQKKQVQKTFLIYNRAWSGTREYRLRFADLVVQHGLAKHCRMSINPVEPELDIHYNDHTFDNPAWQPQHPLENYFTISNAHSHYSADFNIKDYEATDIEVVLETLFDDSRLHLTEKSLRPIACAQPFILAGTPGSLEYLRSYGFKTFGHIWDERYDLVEEPEERLIRIADLMRSIANWTPEQRSNKLAQAQAIADYNKKLFFSTDWHNSIINELKTNLIASMAEMNRYRTGKYFYDIRKVAKYDNSVSEFINKPDHPWRTQQDIETVKKWIELHNS